MVMEASGRNERKYCHCRGGGQRLIRTSRRLMERSTDRFTTTGTNSEPPCCRVGRKQGALVPSVSVTHLCGPRSQNLWEWPERTPEISPAKYLDRTLPGHVAPVGHLY